ncbi:MAG: ISKra4 family transposase [Ktedonobacteraceae bacterium]
MSAAMEPARTVGREFFPLDEQLGLAGAGMTPRGQEALVRLAVWMPFERAGELLKDLLGIQVSATSSRRSTYGIGQAALAVQQAEEERIREELPTPPQGAQRQAISADGAFVPLVGGEWAEVKTLVVAEVGRDKEGAVCTTQVSSFSRLADVETFSQQAVVELHRRGVDRATAVCAVTDGAEWLQGFIDDHCPTAVRILDFAHAAEYVSAMGQAATEAGSALAPKWLEEHLHDLKHEGPQQVLGELRWLHARHPKVTPLGEKLAYLEKREAHMQYPTYQEAGWPIGSGIVESANKLVVEARLKGAGMHWERAHVNPMLTLRNAVCNQRWQEIWQSCMTQRHTMRSERREEQTDRRLRNACWTVLIPLTRLRRLAASPPPSRPVRYSWRQPFLRRPPSSSGLPAKN